MASTATAVQTKNPAPASVVEKRWLPGPSEIYRYVKTAKGTVEVIDLLKKGFEWTKVFDPSAKVDGAIKHLGTAKKCFGPGATVSYLSKTLTSKSTKDIVYNGINAAAEGYGTVKTLGSWGVFEIPSWLENLGLGASTLNLASNTIDFYDSGRDIIDANAKLEKLNKTECSPDEKRAYNEKWYGGALGIIKASIKVFTVLVGIYAILSGKAVVAGIVISALSTIALIASIIKHFLGDMGVEKQLERQEAKRMKDFDVATLIERSRVAKKSEEVSSKTETPSSSESPATSTEEELAQV